MLHVQTSFIDEGGSLDTKDLAPGVGNPETINLTDKHDVTNAVQAAEGAEERSEPGYYSNLQEACRQADTAKLRQIIRHNPSVDINITDSDQGHTPLLALISAAVFNDDGEEAADAIRFLVAHGADINTKDIEGYSGLHHCARCDSESSLRIAKVLIELGANVNADQRPVANSSPRASVGSRSDEKGHDYASDGCECGQHIGTAISAAFKSATGEELHVEEQNKEQDVTPLHHACGVGNNLPVAKLLLDNGAKIDITDAIAGTPLLVAVKSGREEICRLLLGWPGGTALLSKHDRHGRLPIHYAAEVSDRDIAAMLIESGSLVDPIVKEDDTPDHEKGFTPLLMACKNASRRGRLSVIEYLLEHGADALRVAERGQTPLLLSVLSKNVDAAKLLVKYGANPKAAVGPFEDVNALHVAATSGSGDLCHWLVEEAGINVNSHDDQGYTALINAAGYSNSPDTIKMLVSTLHANIEASIHDGRRPLHFAAFKGQLACAEELLSLGADKEAVDDSGWTPLHFAARYHHEEVIRLLLRSGAQIGRKVEGGPQPKRVDGEIIDICGFTAADLARITRDGQECVDVLVAAGDVLSEETKDLKDDDLWKEESVTCCVM